LYIIDGIPVETFGLFQSNLKGYSYDPLLGVNPYDISSVTVVKDPTVTSAYGSKASNGVIFIETLDPSATQTSIDVDLRSGYSLSPANLIPQLNAGQHKTLVNEELFSSGLTEEVTELAYPSLFLKPTDAHFIDYQHDTKWQDKVFQNSSFTNFNLKVKGGDAIARYGLSFGYTSNKGIITNTSYDSYNIRFVTRTNIFRWLRMNAGVSMNYSTSNMKEAATSNETSPILASLSKSPLLNPYQYDSNGNMITTLSEVNEINRRVDEFGISNPVAIINSFKANNTNYHFISTLGFEGTIKKNLFINSNFGLTYNDLKENIFMPFHGMTLYNNGEAYNVAKNTNNYLFSFYNNTYLTYKKVFNKVHSFSSNTGVNIQTNRYQLDWGMAMNSQFNDKYQKLQDGVNNLRQIGGDNRSWDWLSVYENLNYSYKDKYMVSASASLDGSSRIGDQAINTIKIVGSPFGVFYSGGLGWRLSSESFLKNLSWLDELKLRASYGTSGNDDIGEANATNYYQTVFYRSSTGLYPAIIPNPKLSYERVSQINTGADIGVLGNRLRGTVEWFKSKTDDMLILTPLASYFGYGFRPENGGKMQNTGIEVSAFLRIINGTSFKWDVQGNFSKVKNEILALKGDKIISEVQGGEIVNQVGSPANSFYGYIYNGVYSTTDEANSANLVNDKLVKYVGGDAKFADLSGPNGVPDGVINQYDKTAIGSSMPTFYGGFQNTFTYKNWTLNSTINVVSGNKVFNYVRYQNEMMSGLQNQSASVLNRWQFDGQQTNVPRALMNDPVGNSAFSTRWIEDGSYLRVQNVSLSYTISNKFLSFRNAEIYVSANNVLTVSKYLGYDPEFSYSYSHGEQGVDYGQTPQARQFIIGIKLGL
jgi:TonB-linked SusC/RagA family outer membrane protein